MEGIELRARLNPRKIYLLRFVLEAAGHVAWLSTRKKGEVLLRTSRENKAVVRKIVESLAARIGFEGWE